MTELISFFVILMAGVVFTGLFSRLNVPWVVAMIVAGIAIGPHGFDIFEPNQTMSFLAEIGLIFLMFSAGLETRISEIKTASKTVAAIALFNALIPFTVGFGVGMFFDFSMLASLLLGTIFVSSSIAVIIPSLESNKLIEGRLGKTTVAAAVLEDVASLVLLSIILQSVDQVTPLPLPAFYMMLFVLLVLLRWAIPRVEKYVAKKEKRAGELFRGEVRTVFVILLGTVILFEILGLHPIIAGFFTGLVLSDTITSRKLRDRIRTLSYGLFIPVFFVVIGTEADLSVFVGASAIVALLAATIFGSIGSKFISGYIGGRFGGFSRESALVIASATIPSLSTTLAVVFSGVSLGILPKDLITTMVILSLVSTLVSPLLVSYFAKRLNSNA